jgi:hypothetical protein
LKLYLGAKFILAIMILVGLYFLILRSNDGSQSLPSPVVPAVSVLPQNVATKNAPLVVFDSKLVKKFRWSHGTSNVFWPDPKLDAFQVERFLVTLSKLTTPVSGGAISAPPKGTIEISLNTGDVIKGVYDEHYFIWQTGAFFDTGAIFSSASVLADILAEGTDSLKSHILKVCEGLTLNSIEFGAQQKLIKVKDRWEILIANHSLGLADRDTATQIVGQLCKIPVSKFVPISVSHLPRQQIEKFASGKIILNFASSKRIFEKRGSIFSTGKIRFESSELDRLVNINLEPLVDPAVGAGRAILNAALTQEERLKAIREIKKLKSKEAIPALRKLIFEDTDIDIYRYEAVDALAEIGTSDAIKIIADRLAQVSRSGFQLRLARALAAPISEPFTSDENTPDDIRQAEVHELLIAYKKSLLQK